MLLGYIGQTRDLFYQIYFKAIKKKKLWEKKILKIIKKEKINLLIPGLDFELEHLINLKNRIEKISCKLLISNKDIITIFNDKWNTYNYLKKNNFFYPNTTLKKGLRRFLDKNKFPLIVKPRRGSTSKNVFLVKNLSELRKAIKNCPNPIIQEYLFANNNEYTCGTIMSEGNLLSSIVLKRKLKNGNTVQASYKNNNATRKITNFIEKLTKKINPEGPLNLQLCYKNNKPIVFEINPRFSGTTPLREIFGLNEIEIYINYLENKKLRKFKKNFREGTVLRYFDNFFVNKII